jgi:hypothetical protein
MRANLSGANLQHARNLTERQLYGSIGNASTILPPHLKRPASWAELIREPPSEYLRNKAHEHGPIRKKLTWKAGAFLCVGGVVVAGFVWLHGTQAVRPDTDNSGGAGLTRQIERTGLGQAP